MNYATVFERVEMKYLLNSKQKARLMKCLNDHMKLDQYGRTTIRNLYYDTDTWRLVRDSIEKPVYKEKLRVRSYSQVHDQDTVFVELKKKYKDIVYKRRIPLPHKDTLLWLAGKEEDPRKTQISREIDYFCRFYQSLHPRMFLSYEREAYYSPEREDFRLTLDENILYRTENFNLTSSVWGSRILDPGVTLMELKTAGGLPEWILEFLSENKVYKTSFSKYGTAYQQLMQKELLHNQGGVQYA